MQELAGGGGGGGGGEGGLTRHHPSVADSSPVSLRRVSEKRRRSRSPKTAVAAAEETGDGLLKVRGSRPKRLQPQAGHSCFRRCTQLAVAMPQPQPTNQRQRWRAEVTPTRPRWVKQLSAGIRGATSVFGQHTAALSGCKTCLRCFFFFFCCSTASWFKDPVFSCVANTSWTTTSLKVRLKGLSGCCHGYLFYFHFLKFWFAFHCLYL